MKEILLGYEIDSGEEVYIEPTHLVVTGLSNKSGKTTTLEAIAARAGLKVLVFLTKRGEKVFTKSRNVDPYFKERSDWLYVEQLLEATMKERMKFERSWIITACKGTTGLRQVYENVQRLKKHSRDGSLQQSIYTSLEAYFDLVLPTLEKMEDRLSDSFPDLTNGTNVMDLTGIREEVQALIIGACLEYIQENLNGIVVIIPELWKFSPEGRGSPVKRVLEALVRQGATNDDFVWFDSQDLAGVDKSPLKQVFTWILGLQTEKNEAKHTLDQMPLRKSQKPEPAEIMTLKKGHFILASPDAVKKVYVQPVWLMSESAIRVARGEISVSEAAKGAFEDTVVDEGAHQRGTSEVPVMGHIEGHLTDVEYHELDKRVKAVEEARTSAIGE